MCGISLADRHNIPWHSESVNWRFWIGEVASYIPARTWVEYRSNSPDYWAANFAGHGLGKRNQSAERNFDGLSEAGRFGDRGIEIKITSQHVVEFILNNLYLRQQGCRQNRVRSVARWIFLVASISQEIEYARLFWWRVIRKCYLVKDLL